MKHEKDQFVSFMKDITNINEDSDELSLHHDYNISASKKSRQVHLLTNYITTMGNPFMSGDRLINN